MARKHAEADRTDPFDRSDRTCTRPASNGGAGIRFPWGPRLADPELACAATEWLVTACERAVVVHATKAVEILACPDIEEGLVSGVGGDLQSIAERGREYVVFE